MKLFEALNGLWDAFVEWLEDIGEDVLDFVKPLGKQIAAGGGALLVEAARQAVKAAEAEGGSGRDKFNAAQSKVVEVLEKQGINVIINAVNGAIEAAVAGLKK
jgi:hypothetical protein